MLWLAVGALIFAALTGAAAGGFGYWVARRGDTLHEELAAAQLSAAAAVVQSENLRKELTAAAAAMTDERARHHNEIIALEADLETANARLAAIETPDGLAASLSRGPKS